MISYYLFLPFFYGRELFLSRVRKQKGVAHLIAGCCSRVEKDVGWCRTRGDEWEGEAKERAKG